MRVAARKALSSQVRFQYLNLSTKGQEGAFWQVPHRMGTFTGACSILYENDEKREFRNSQYISIKNLGMGNKTDVKNRHYLVIHRISLKVLQMYPLSASMSLLDIRA